MSNQDLAHLRPATNTDEIDLGELIRNLVAQWRLIFSITLLGALLSIIYAISQPKTYKVSAIASLPTPEQLGEATAQTLIDIDPNSAYLNFLDQLSSYQVKQSVFEQSSLLTKLKEQSQATITPTEVSFDLLNSTLKSFSVTRLKRDYVELKTDEATPLLDVAIELETTHPVEAAAFINQLLDSANKLAIAEFESNLAKVKSERMEDITNRINQQTAAAKNVRLALIGRTEETNALEIAKLEQKIELDLQKAKNDRENRIKILEDALNVATELNIEHPTSWDNLRKTLNQSQITNKFNEQAQSEPLYFQGTRILTAEIKRLKSRESDEPFVSSVTDYKRSIESIKNDPYLANLKNRADDTIYIEGLDTLIKELATIEAQITAVPSTLFVNRLAPAFVPNTPIKPNKTIIVIAGTVLAGFLSLFMALIRIAVRSDQE